MQTFPNQWSETYRKPQVNDRTFGHKWQFKYDVEHNDATLYVAIVDYDRETGKITQLHFEETHELAASLHKGVATIVLPIKDRILETYNNASKDLVRNKLKATPIHILQLDDIESYIGFYVKATGIWLRPLQGKIGLVNHPSIQFSIMEPGPARDKGKALFVTALDDGHNQNLSRGGGSEPFIVYPDTEAQLSSHFFCNSDEKRFHAPRPQQFVDQTAITKFEARTYMAHNTWTKTGLDYLGATTFGDWKRVLFDITEQKMTITTDSAAFQLKEFIIDPVSSGHGNGD